MYECIFTNCEHVCDAFHLSANNLISKEDLVCTKKYSVISNSWNGNGHGKLLETITSVCISLVICLISSKVVSGQPSAERCI